MHICGLSSDPNLVVEPRRLDGKRGLDREKSDMFQVVRIETFWIVRFAQHEYSQRRITRRQERDHQQRRPPQGIAQLARGGW
jgi:hypothetical protein